MSPPACPGMFGSRLHDCLCEAAGLDYVYKVLHPLGLEGAVRALQALGTRGCGVSIPFKEAVVPMLELEPSAMVLSPKHLAVG